MFIVYWCCHFQHSSLPSPSSSSSSSLIAKWNVCWNMIAMCWLFYIAQNIAAKMENNPIGIVVDMLSNSIVYAWNNCLCIWKQLNNCKYTFHSENTNTHMHTARESVSKCKQAYVSSALPKIRLMRKKWSIQWSHNLLHKLA